MTRLRVELGGPTPFPAGAKRLIVGLVVLAAFLGVGMLVAGLNGDNSAVPLAMGLFGSIGGAAALYGLQMSVLGPRFVDCDDRRISVQDHGPERTLLWDRLAWAYVRQGRDTRDGLGNPFGKAGWSAPFYVMLQDERPPYVSGLSASSASVGLRVESFAPGELASILGHVVEHAAPAAVDPTLVLLIGLCARIDRQSQVEPATPVSSAARKLDPDAMTGMRPEGESDFAIRAMFSCLAGHKTSAGDALRALEPESDAWDLRLCLALSASDRSTADASSLLAIVLDSPDLPQPLLQPLEAAAKSGTTAWYEPQP